MIDLTRDGPVATITLNHPPVNALNAALRQALMQALRDAAAIPGLAAVVLRAAGRSFVSGADLREMEAPRPDPSTADLAMALEDMPVPVVAALHGHVLGGGLELALGCQHRVAAETTRFGLPELSLGILAAGGGVQRLTRLLGMAPALELVLGGATLSATEALALGLIDAVGVDPYAIAAAPPAPRCRLSRMLAKPDPAALAEWQARLAHRMADEPAIAANLAAVARAEKPFAEAIAADEAAFLALRVSPQSRARRTAFLERRRQPA